MKRKSKLSLTIFLIAFCMAALGLDRQRAKGKLVSLSPTSNASLSSFPVLPDGDRSPHASLLYSSTPEIQSVHFPKRVKSHHPFTVTARIANNPLLTNFSQTTWARLTYVYQGKRTLLWMEEKKKGEFLAKLPGFEPGKVTFYLEAGDNTGNRVVEIDTAEESAFPPDDQSLHLLLVDRDDPVDWVEDSIDIQELWIGLSREELFVKLKVEGNVLRQKRGKLLLYGYIAAIYNPDARQQGGLLDAKAAVYAPGLTVMGLPPFGLFSLSLLGGDLKQAQAAPVQLKVIKRRSPGTIYFGIKRSLLGANPCHCLQWGAMTLIAGKIGDEFSAGIVDATSYVRTVEQHHTIEVKG